MTKLWAVRLCSRAPGVPSLLFAAVVTFCILVRLPAWGIECVGDCNSDADVSVDEVVSCVRIALGQTFDDCDSCDENGDGQVSIDELIRTVDSGMQDCSGEPDNVAEDAKPIGCGERQTRSMASGGDVDFLVFSLAERTAITVEASALDGQIDLTLRSGFGTLLEQQSFPIIDRQCGTDALEPGEYFIEVGGFSFVGTEFPYDIVLSCTTRCDVPNPTPTPTFTPTPTLTPLPPDGFEPDDSAAMARPIACGNSQGRSLSSGDVDWVSLVLPEQSAVVISASGQSGETELTLRSASQQFIESDDGFFGPAMIDRVCGLDALPGGSYLIEVASLFGSISSYDLTVTCVPCLTPNPTATPTSTPTPTLTPVPPDPFEPDNAADEAKPIACGEAQVRTLSPQGDVDYIGFTLSERTTVRIEARGADASIDLGLRSATGDLIEGGFSSHIERQCGIDALESGQYLIEVSGFGFSRPDVGYDVVLVCIPCDVPNPTPTATATRTPTATATPTVARDPFEPDNIAEDAKPIECGEMQRCSLSPVEADFLVFTLTERSAVSVEAFAFDAEIHLTLRSRFGTILERQFGQNIDRQCGTDGLEPGEYFIEVGGFSFFDTEFAYDIVLNCTTPCDVPNATPTPTFTRTPTPSPTRTLAPDSFEPDDSAATAKRIACGDSQRRSLPPGDVDWASLVLAEQSAVVISASGPGGDTTLTLLGGSQQFIESDDPFDGSAMIDRVCSLDALPRGSYLIQVGSFFGDSIPGYDLTVTCVPCLTPNPTATPTTTPTPTATPALADRFEPDDAADQAKPIACGEAQVRTLSPQGDLDYIAFTLSERTTVRIEARAAAASIDLELRSATGDPIEGGFSSQIERECGFDALEAGEYFIEVSGVGFSRPEFGYDVVLVCIPCDLPNPTPTATPTPTPTTPPDAFEPDDVAEDAKPIACGETQTRSLVPGEDVDWVGFVLPERSAVVISTSGESGGDTILTLRDEDQGYIEDDDDSGDGAFSLIDRVCGEDELSAGSYFIEVAPFGGFDLIPSYDLTLTCVACDGSAARASRPRHSAEASASRFTATPTPTPTPPR